jgi:hypothetical protein
LAGSGRLDGFRIARDTKLVSGGCPV